MDRVFLVVDGQVLTQVISKHILKDQVGIGDVLSVEDPTADVPGIIFVTSVRFEGAGEAFEDGEEVTLGALSLGIILLDPPDVPTVNLKGIVEISRVMVDQTLEMGVALKKLGMTSRGGGLEDVGELTGGSTLREGDNIFLLTFDGGHWSNGYIRMILGLFRRGHEKRRRGRLA